MAIYKSWKHCTDVSSLLGIVSAYPSRQNWDTSPDRMAISDSQRLAKLNQTMCLLLRQPGYLRSLKVKVLRLAVQRSVG